MTINPVIDREQGAASAVGKCCRISARMLAIADDGISRDKATLARIRAANAGQARLLDEAADIADEMLTALLAVQDWADTQSPVAINGYPKDDVDNAVLVAREGRKP